MARHYSDSLFNDICKCEFKIHEIFHKRAEYALFRLKTTLYESGKKQAGSWLDSSENKVLHM